jgi:signal transduction histidine kinase
MFIRIRGSRLIRHRGFSSWAVKQVTMKNDITRFERRYALALRRCVQAAGPSKPDVTLRLGRQAVQANIQTLGLARIHEQSLLQTDTAGDATGRKRLSDEFFAQVVGPIVETHRASRENQRQLKVQSQTLGRRTRELATANRQLELGILRRREVEAALRQSGAHYAKLLQDSQHLQKGLRRLTQQVLAAQEEERKKISLTLQDQIAQTLVGIELRLCSLKKEARFNTQSLKAEIASTQRLVAKSAQSVRKVARQFGGL